MVRNRRHRRQPGDAALGRGARSTERVLRNTQIRFGKFLLWFLLQIVFNVTNYEYSNTISKQNLKVVTSC